MNVQHLPNLGASLIAQVRDAGESRPHRPSAAQQENESDPEACHASIV
jgi:hypothetical protein